jgi:PPM family protein phosphatase
MTLVLRYSARSDRGLVRQNNQDAVYAGPRLLALADGMGGHAAGEVASSLVISALAPLDEDDPGDDLLAELREATVEGNAAITRHVADSPDLEGMGTTLTAILFAGSRLGLVHIGDSRAYQLRDGALSQITKDDTFVQSLIDEGRITEEEAHTHPQRSLLLRAITGQDIDPSLTMREARPGDRYLLCSDGLSGVVSDETLAETLATYRDPRECADRMIELALRGGGPDNVTVIVADVINARVGDKIDDVPVIAGAFVDPAAADIPGADSAAERAANLSRPAPAEAPPTPHRNRRSWRPWLFALAAVILVVAALGGTYAWTQTQYFVGKAGADVAIYRGVNTEFGPLKFFNVYKVSNLPVDNLQPSYRGQVHDGITAHSKQEAESIVANLRKQQLPGCLDNVGTSATTSPVPPATSTTPATGTSTTPAGGTSTITPAPTTVAPCPVPPS